MSGSSGRLPTTSRFVGGVAGLATGCDVPGGRVAVAVTDVKVGRF